MTHLHEHAADLFGLSLTPEQQAAFSFYERELLAWNTHTNLTTITDPEAITVRHFLDSLSVSPVLPRTEGIRLIDVGAGAGFPGLPLTIVFPRIQVTLLEATGKKTRFLNHIITTLNLPNATTLNARAEEAGQMPDQRAQYAVAVARAVARLPALLEYLLPLVQIGGQAIAMKGETAPEEIADARRALDILGGQVKSVEAVKLPGLEDIHHLIVIEKIAPTPPQYPRRPGVPTRKPL